ncbi:hypothetical protein BaRGS_00005973 [Batillaria attramentaria]|uniref:Uncharacterized protein n=1 Tax=Batillaria attramentaria TaxID=370345 RepID=A0ABD0LU56_9CAEN
MYELIPEWAVNSAQCVNLSSHCHHGYFGQLFIVPREDRSHRKQRYRRNPNLSSAAVTAIGKQLCPFYCSQFVPVACSADHRPGRESLSRQSP